MSNAVTPITNLLGDLDTYADELGAEGWLNAANACRAAIAEIERLTAAIPLMGVQREDVARHEWWHDHIRCPGCSASPVGFCIHGCTLQDCPMGRALAEAEPPVLALPHTGQPQEGCDFEGAVEAGAMARFPEWFAEDACKCAVCEKDRNDVRADARIILTAALPLLSAAPAPSARGEADVTFCYVTYRACTASCPTREECALGKVMARIDAAPLADQRGES